LLPKIPDRFHTLDVGSETRRGETPCGCGCQGFCYSYLGDFRETFWGFLFFFQGILLKLQPFRVVFFWWGVLIAEISFGSYARDSLLLGDPRDASWNS